MKKIFVGPGTLPAIVVLVLLCGLLFAQPAPTLKLTKLSDREWVDLSKLSFIRLPVNTLPDPSCAPYCQTRWGADIVVDGVSMAYSEEAEITLRRLLEQK